MQDNNKSDSKNIVEENLQEIMKKIPKSEISESEAKVIISKINNEFDFQKILQELSKKHPLGNDKYIIFTQKNEQLSYENGEFFLIATTDISKPKKKITRMQALELYNQYYITNVLNPLLKKKESVNKGNLYKDIEVDNSNNSVEVKKEINIESQSGKVIEETERESKSKEVNLQEEIELKLNELKEKEKKIRQKREDRER